MATVTQPTTLSSTIQQCAREDKGEVVERNEEVDLIWLCIVARVHYLFLGDPGLAKSLLVRLAHRHATDAQYFERLVFKQSPAEEVLGPVSLAALRQDRYERVTTGKLPEAHMAFIDEVFKANATILNSMLTILNERVFHNNGGTMPANLWSCGFASNELPGLDRDDLRAFRDRIAVTKIVQDVRSDDSFKTILKGQMARERGQSLTPSLTTLTVADIEAAQAEVADIIVPEDVLDELTRLRRSCQEANLAINPRRFGQGLKLMQARAYIAGRQEALVDDMKVFQHVIWREPEDEQTAFRILLDFASEYERAAAKFQDDFDPINAEFHQLSAEGKVDPTDDQKLQQAIRVKRLHDALRQRVMGKVEDAQKDGRDTSALDGIVTSIDQNINWLKANAFGGI